MCLEFAGSRIWSVLAVWNYMGQHGTLHCRNVVDFNTLHCNTLHHTALQCCKIAVYYILLLWTQLQSVDIWLKEKKSRIRETSNLSTDADNRTDTNFFSKIFFLQTFCSQKNFFPKNFFPKNFISKNFFSKNFFS